MTGPAIHTSPVRDRSRPTLFAAVAVAVAMVVALSVGWWAHAEGYIPGWSQSCDDRGWPTPPPSFDELVHDKGLDPYCARAVSGDTWY